MTHQEADGPSEEDLDAELARRSFVEFVRLSWPEIDPRPLIWNWHIEAIAEHLQAVGDGLIQRLLINIPPGHAKSVLVSVLWPVWMWIRNPAWQLMTASYGIDLSIRDAVKSRILLETPWFKQHYMTKWKLSSDQNVKSYYVNDKRGFRLCLSVAGKGTGWRGDGLIIDDPLNANDAHSKLARDEVIRWKTETMSSRFNDLSKAIEVCIMQRLHEDDLSGYLLRHGGWEHLCLPSEFESKRRQTTSIGWTDPRSDDGELLFPALFPKEVLERAKGPEGMGSTAYAGQHQQEPMPATGGIFKKPWWRYWAFEGDPLPADEEIRTRTVIIPRREFWDRYFDETLISADCAFKDTSSSDLVAIGGWGRKGPFKFLLELFWQRAGFNRTVEEIKRIAALMPRLSAVYVEDKANGSAVIETLKSEMSAVIDVDPKGGKESRAQATSPQVEGGNVLLPIAAAWLQKYIDEHAAFPKASHDDVVDMQSQLLIQIRDRNVSVDIEDPGTPEERGSIFAEKMA